MKRIVLDTETGGLDSKKNDCLSIGYVIIEDTTLQTITQGEILIKGRRSRCLPEALAVNKIDLKKHNRKALTKKDARIAFRTIIKKHFGREKVLVIGNNIPFDVGFIKTIWPAFKISHSTVDLKDLWRGLNLLGVFFCQSAKQDDILNYLKIKAGSRHTALEDARNLVRILTIIQQKICWR